jgi:hypothetical protein
MVAEHGDDRNRQAAEFVGKDLHLRRVTASGQVTGEQQEIGAVS